MKILIFNWRDIKSPDFGGAEVATYELARRWVKWGHQVTWFSSKFKNCQEKEIIDGIKIIRQGSPFTVHLKAFLYYKKHFKGKFDIIIDQVHGIPFFTPLYVKEPKIVYIHEVAGKIWFWQWPQLIALFGYLSDLLSFRIFYRKIKFITGSLSTLEDLQSAGIPKNNIKIVNYGISKIKISPKIKKGKVPTLIFLGRLYRSKRVEEILNSTKLLVKKYPKMQLWIVGRGIDDYEEKLKNLSKSLKIDKNVNFYGFLEEKQKNELLQKAWVLIMTSVKEGWGLTITEAAAMKTPAVVYNTGGLKDAVINNKTGIVCQKNTPYTLAKNIDQLFTNSKLRKILGQNARKFAKSFSWDKAAKETLEIINDNFDQNKRLKEALAKNFWNKKEYIEIQSKFDYDTNSSFWMNLLREKSKNAKKILDVGCCEGTRLSQLNHQSHRFGLDISKTAIKKGSDKYKDIKFIQADAEKIPFPDSFFDLVFSAFTLEHLTSPEKAIDEMIRVAKNGGTIVLIAPNFGSPLILDPRSKETSIKNIVGAAAMEIKHLSGLNNLQLNWKKVQPRLAKKFTSDDDSVNQPYLPSLIWMSKAKGLKIDFFSSGWEDAQTIISNKFKKMIFLVSKKSQILKLYPLKYWGPTLFLICRK